MTKGRKPKGAVAARPLTIRMPEDLRAELEAAAQESGTTVTDELVGRLEWASQELRDIENDRATKSVMMLIQALAHRIYRGEVPNWNQNPFWFRSFKVGIAQLLDALEPKGKIVRPPFKFGPDTPEELGKQAAEAVLRSLWHQREERPGRHPTRPSKRPFQLTDDEMDRAFAKLRYDLGIDKLGEQKK